MGACRVAWRAAASLIGALAGSLLAGSVDGRVVEHHSGLPVLSADVRVLKAGDPSALADLVTDAEGRFRAPGLSAGEYRIEVAKPNYAGAVLRIRVAESESSETRVLVRCAVITGRVANLQGEPLRGARVFTMVKSAEGQLGRPFAHSGPGSFSFVDERGQYRLYGLVPGEYAIAVSYGASGGMVGSVRGAAGGSGVVFYPDNTRPRLFTVSGGEEYQGVDFVLQPTRRYRVSGRVELPAPSARFWLALASIAQPALAVATTLAQADGSFRFEGIPSGSYRLFASGPMVAVSGPGAVLTSEPLFGQTQAEVIEQDVEELSIPVQKGRSVAFVLRYAAPHGTDGGCPQVAGLTLSPLEDWGALVHRSAELSLARKTIIDHLPNGHYRLSVSQLGETCYPSANAVLDLTGANHIDPVVVLVSPAGSLHGRLRGSVNSAQVAVVLAATDPVDGAPPVQIAFPDPESRFTFGNVRPGRYRIAAEPAVEVTKPGWIAQPGRMFEIEVPGGAPTDVELPAFAVAGKKPEGGT